MYVLPLSDNVRHHGISFHSYADDTQLYVEFNHKDPNSIMAAVESLESFVEDVRIWMLRNRLKMNDIKTEMMVFAPPRAKLPVLSVFVGPEVHQPAASVRNLGLVMDTYGYGHPRCQDLPNWVFPIEVHQIGAACSTPRRIGETCPCIHYSSPGLLQFCADRDIN